MATANKKKSLAAAAAKLRSVSAGQQFSHLNR
jgi:hypothetical protein